MRKLSTVGKGLLFGLLLIALDQLTKGLAQAFLPGHSIHLSADWGLVYKTNAGIWLNNHLAPKWFPLIRLAALVVWTVALFAARFYERHYRKSGWVVWAVAFLTGAVFGNVFIDRLLFGEIRDFILNPIAVSNLADIYSSLMTLSFAAELVSFPKARRLLAWRSLRHQWRETRVFARFTAHAVKAWMREMQRKGRPF